MHNRRIGQSVDRTLPRNKSNNIGDTHNSGEKRKPANTETTAACSLATSTDQCECHKQSKYIRATPINGQQPQHQQQSKQYWFQLARQDPHATDRYPKQPNTVDRHARLEFRYTTNHAE